MKKILYIAESTKIAKLRAHEQSKELDKTIEFRPIPVIVSKDQENHYIGVDFMARVVGQKFDDVIVDLKLVNKLKMAQKGLIQTLKK